jgi:putative membrane protein
MEIIFASISCVLHILFFFLESVFFEREQIHYLFGIKTTEVISTKVIFFNQGFYNLFLAIGAAVGIYYYGVLGEPLLLVYVSAYMAGASFILYISKRSMYRAALIQGVSPLITLILFAI